MTSIVFGIYGFDFCRPHAIGPTHLRPRFDYPDSGIRGRDPAELWLTGIGTFTHEPVRQERTDILRWLGDGMTFAQQQRVVVTHPIALSPGDSINAMIESRELPESLPLLDRRDTAGGIICHDAFCRHSIGHFLEHFTNHVGAAPEGDPLIGALYRQIEIWRLSVQLVEIEHFLAFSGLEMLARGYGEQSEHHNAAVPISRFLTSLGFDVPQRLAERWCAARNACFHRGRLRAADPGTGDVVDVADDLNRLTPLLADAALKQLGFEHEHINWNRWRDRMPFQ